ncbi:hypothetical protein RQP53_17265 [Paucibacter sp. APW11]|uniref:DUF4124 domain-containing protein n=1 Tax=Roseateles aquae TaxID=3077235 RepID=A0ABU3PEQ5_9BURK|nr:hypothetical protein [Paucibacter sp. APW11]MDT9001031.1 hypothetical protein [Paucibacter sp. APW11]
MRHFRLHAVVPCAALVLLAGALSHAQAPAPRLGSIYSCTTPDGRKLTSDRPIADCASREQRILNSDGSQRGVLPPAMSPEERAVAEANERKLALERARQADAVRRDRNLMTRFPTEDVHQRAREAALDDIKTAMRSSESRIKSLAVERKPLLDEAEFYKGKALPPKLKQQLDANDVAVEAQRTLIENQKAEMVRVNKNYDAELARLKRLWAGAAPGASEKSASAASR